MFKRIKTNPKIKRTNGSNSRSGLKAIVIIVILFLAVITVLIMSYESLKSAYRDTFYPKLYSETVEYYSEIYDIDENFIYAIIKTESGFDTNATSEDGAKGLMQVTEETFDWLSTKMEGTDNFVHDDLYTPEIGIMYGCFFIDYLTNEFSNQTVVLVAYHAGRGITNQWLSDKAYSSDGLTLNEIPYSDTAHYVNKVLKNYASYTCGGH